MSRDVEILEAAWKKIENPENWCQGRFSLDSSGKDVDYDNTEAYRFCATGALFSVDKYLESLRPLRDAARKLFDTTPVRVNDELGYYAVRQMYAEAIRMAKEENA